MLQDQSHFTTPHFNFYTHCNRPSNRHLQYIYIISTYLSNIKCPFMASMLLTPFAINGSYIMTLCSVFAQSIQVLDTLFLYILRTLALMYGFNGNTLHSVPKSVWQKKHWWIGYFAIAQQIRNDKVVRWWNFWRIGSELPYFPSFLLHGSN